MTEQMRKKKLAHLSKIKFFSNLFLHTSQALTILAKIFLAKSSTKTRKFSGNTEGHRKLKIKN